MNRSSKIALIAVTRRGVEQARRLRVRLRSGALHRPERYGPAPQPWEHSFESPLSQIVPALFAEFDQLVFFLATGAVTRLVAPCLSSKTSDPGVLAVDEAGQFVVPVLSGHQGGANAFARTVAGLLGATPVITTASDVLGGLSLDLLEEAWGWTVEPADKIKPAALALVNGAPVAVVQEVGCRGQWLDEQALPETVTFVNDVHQLPGKNYASILWITDRLVDNCDRVHLARRSRNQTAPSPPASGGEGWGEGGRNPAPEQDCLRGDLTPSPPSPSPAALPRSGGEGRKSLRPAKILTDNCTERILWCRPRSLVLGVGCERGIAYEALREGLETFLREHGFSSASIGTLATVDVKADESALLELAEEHGWQTVFYAAEELSRVAGIPNPSSVVERCVGTPGVAEPAALLASCAERLLVEKQVVTSARASQRMTFALARLASYQIRDAAKGSVVFIGAGPGDPDLLTVKARRVLERADAIVYAGSLIPETVLQGASKTAVLYNSAPLTLEEVMRITVDAVRAGKRVVRLQSGDTSIYSALQEQMTLLDEAGISYEVIPGISSFQAAAAALKTELTLPEEVQTVILTRGEGETKMPAGEALAALARHGATLCIFLSARLCDQVREDLLTAYSPDTPVAIFHRVSWPDEVIVMTDLNHFSSEVKKHKFTRTTLILVGKAVGGRGNRSCLYDKTHGHIFRAKSREEKNPAS